MMKQIVFVLLLIVVLSMSFSALQAQDFAEIVCDDGAYESFDALKPPLEIGDLPKPNGEWLYSPARSIGYMFPNGQVGFIATPTSNPCMASYDGFEGRVAGVVWAYDEDILANTYVLAIDPHSESGYLLSMEMEIIDDYTFWAEAIGDFPVVSEQVEVPAAASLVLQHDVAIRPEGICFIWDEMGEFIRSCTQTPEFSVRERYAEAFETTLFEIIEEGINYLGPSFDLNVDASISEIEGVRNISECELGLELSGCGSDMILVPAFPGSSDTELGLLIVLQPLDYLELDPGWYILNYDAGINYDDVLSSDSFEIRLSGMTMEGDTVDDHYIEMGVAPFVSEDDMGVAEITGWRIFWWCPKDSECH